MPLMEKIRTMIRAHREGPCLPSGDLGRLYREQLVDQIPFNHILCCEQCLDVVNTILGLPPLEERHPFDTLTRQSSDDRSDPPSEAGQSDRKLSPDDVEPDVPIDETFGEGEEEVEEPTISFERVQQAMARSYEVRPEQLLVYINGRPSISLSAEQARQTSTLWSEEEIEFTEVRSEDGILLACMDVDERGLGAAPQQGRVMLSGNREIELGVCLDPAGQATVQVKYHDPLAEAAVIQATEEPWWAKLAAFFGWKHGMEAGWRVPALAMIMAVVLLGGTSILISSLIKTRGELAALTQEREQMRQQIDQLTKDLEQARQRLAPMRGQSIPVSPSKPKAAPETTLPGPSEIAQVEPTRGHKGQSAAMPLLAVRRVYVAPLGNDLFSQQVRERLINRLQASGRFSVTDKQDEADAVLKGSAKREATQLDQRSGQEVEVGSVRLQLANANGDVLWATTQRDSAADVAARVVKGILKEIQRLKRSGKESTKP